MHCPRKFNILCINLDLLLYATKLVFNIIITRNHPEFLLCINC